MSDAEKMVERFGGDGRASRDASGVKAEDALFEACGSRCIDETTRGGADLVRWVCSDGSVIISSQVGLDIGYPDCFCAQGAGHYECELSGQ